MSDDIAGDYDSIEGIKKRARELGNPEFAALVEHAEQRVQEVDGGYSLQTPDKDSNSTEMFFHMALLTGAALEREYPAPDE